MKIKAILSIAALALSSSAYALSISFSTLLPLSPSDWDDSLTFPLFDPSLGTLTSVNVRLTGLAEIRAQVESLDAKPSTVTADVEAKIKVSRPDLTTLAEALPAMMASWNFTAFDGIIDFGGSSGADTGLVSASDLDSQTYSNAADLALFTGAGSISLPVDARGTSFGSGAGNLIELFNTSAGASVEVTYAYDPNTTKTPDAGSTLAMLGGVLGLMGVVRRKLA